MTAMNWYLIHTKPRQEKCALQNLEQQGYECYLPLLPTEKLRQGMVTVTDEALFPRYLFIRLGRGESALSWTPIRSTKGVSRLVCFGTEPAKVGDTLIELLQAGGQHGEAAPKRLFNAGEQVMLTEGAFAGIEGIYQMADGERRAMVLIELMSRPVQVRVAPSALRKLG